MLSNGHNMFTFVHTRIISDVCTDAPAVPVVLDKLAEAGDNLPALAVGYRHVFVKRRETYSFQLVSAIFERSNVGALFSRRTAIVLGLCDHLESTNLLRCLAGHTRLHFLQTLYTERWS